MNWNFNQEGIASGVENAKNFVSRSKDYFYEATVGRAQKRKADKKAAGVVGEHASHALVTRLKPRKGYVFRSDYFIIDDKRYGCILGFAHNDGARDSFDAFWGVYRLPYKMSQRVSLTLLEQSVVLSKNWVARHSSTANRLSEIDSRNQGSGSDKRKIFRASKRSQELTEIGRELEDGASYLNIQQRLLIIADSLDLIDEAVMDIESSYATASRIPSVTVHSFMGDTRRELSTLLYPNEIKRGKGWHMTSTEYAGMYHLMGRGLNDPNGIYLGQTVGETNNGAVFGDLDGFSSHVVVGDRRKFGPLDRGSKTDTRPRVSDMVALKISQNVLMNNGKVVHFVLNGCNVAGLTGHMSSTSVFFDASRHAVNPFEVFGEKEDKLHLFNASLEKLALIVEQFYDRKEGRWTTIKGKLSRLLEDFYIDRGMWVHNAKDNLRRVRLVNIPHESVPRLSMFKAYLETEKKTVYAQGSTDPKEIGALNTIINVVEVMLGANGDLFDVTSDDLVDDMKNAARTIVDVSMLVKRSSEVMMAQLINVLQMSTAACGSGDVVVFHGTNLLNDVAKPGIRKILDQLAIRGVRVVFSYDSLSDENGVGALQDSAFNRFEKASYTMLSTMTKSELSDYEAISNKQVPDGLRNWLSDASSEHGEGEDVLVFFRRGMENVLFRVDFSLGKTFDSYIKTLYAKSGGAK